eukprot:6557563-Pyramimonas_sp.AAC.1
MYRRETRTAKKRPLGERRQGERRQTTFVRGGERHGKNTNENYNIHRAAEVLSARLSAPLPLLAQVDP